MSDTPEFAVVVDGSRYEIDPASITLGERRLVRVEFAKLDGGVETDNFDLIAGLIWLAVRRVHPEFTLQRILDSVTVGSLEPPKVEVDGLDPEG